MQEFEKELLELPKNFKYRTYINPFQCKMNENLNQMKTNNINRIIVAADKTSNYYTCELSYYEKQKMLPRITNAQMRQSYQK